MEEYKLKDPVEVVLSKLKKDFDVSEEDIEAINERVKAEVEESVKFAEESPWPDISEVLRMFTYRKIILFIMDLGGEWSIVNGGLQIKNKQ